jgi:signal transduction histidine kinase
VRRRLLISTLAVSVTAVVLLGVPLAFVIGRLQLSEFSAQVRRDANTMARSLQEQVKAGIPVTPNEVGKSLPDRYVIINHHLVGRITVGTRPPRGHTISSQAETKDFTVTVEADDSEVTARVTRALLGVGALAGLAVAVAVGLAVWMARRLTRPMEELALAAERLGSGDARPLGRRYGIPELDQVAEGLDGSAQRITDLLSAGRDFAADASHQLRTPLTALSMRLEEMIARRSVAGTPSLASVDDIVAQQVVEWDPAFRRIGRKLVVTGERGMFAYVTPVSAAQVIATLLDNALVHGDGTVTIRTSQTPKSVVVEVRDQGKGVPQDLAPRIFERSVSGRPGGTGLGLALARSVIVADGGQVVLVRPRPAVFAVFLPQGSAAVTEQPVVSGPA